MLGSGNPPQIVETIIPLNRYGFFEELSDKILPPMQLEIKVTLQSDAESIWQNDGTDRRVVVRTSELMGPQASIYFRGTTRYQLYFFLNQRAGDF